MKLLGAAVRYDYPEFVKVGPKWSNNPSLEIETDLEDLTPYKDLRFVEKNGVYYAEHGNGIVATIYKDDITKPDQGFGGSGHSVTMVDGTVRKWSGGWHTNPAHIYAAGHPMVIDCAVGITKYKHTKFATFVTVELAHQALEEFCPEWELYLHYDRGRIGPGLKRKDRPPKNPCDWSSDRKDFIKGLSADQAFIVEA